MAALSLLPNPNPRTVAVGEFNPALFKCLLHTFDIPGISRSGRCTGSFRPLNSCPTEARLTREGFKRPP